MFGKLMLVGLAAAALLQPASAQHSRAAYDMTQEIVVEGTIVGHAWKNPHIFVTVATENPAGEPYRLEIEVTSVSEAPVLGLTREAPPPCRHAELQGGGRRSRASTESWPRCVRGR
jgi:hypothetical protein